MLGELGEKGIRRSSPAWTSLGAFVAHPLAAPDLEIRASTPLELGSWHLLLSKLHSERGAEKRGRNPCTYNGVGEYKQEEGSISAQQHLCGEH